MAPSLSFHLLSSSAKSNYLIPVLVCQLDDTHIIRTLDPEYPHQISFARILHAADIPIVTGLVKFKLVRGPDYCTTLGVSGPNLTEIWISIAKARTLIAQIWPTPSIALIELTSPALDPCWSLFDQTRSSLLHNWTLSTIPPVAYSTALLLETVFSVNQVNHEENKSGWTRTGIPKVNKTADEQDPLDTAMIKWSVSASERYLNKDDTEIIDEWSPVITAVDRLIDTETSEDGPLPTSGLDSIDQFEVTVVASYEMIIRSLFRRPRRPQRKPIRRMEKRKVEVRDMSVQTTIQEVIEEQPITNLSTRARSAMKATQTDIIQVYGPTLRNLPFFLAGLIIGFVICFVRIGLT